MPQIPHGVQELTVGQLSARSGVAVSALHFYESKGLISSRRTPGNQRRYARDTLRRVAFVRAAQRVGIPLATVRDALAALPGERTPTREDWARLSRDWRSELDRRIAQLGRLRDHLTDCIGCGCLSLDRCVLSNPDDLFGARRSGSALLADRDGAGSRASGEEGVRAVDDDVREVCTEPGAPAGPAGRRAGSERGSRGRPKGRSGA